VGDVWGGERQFSLSAILADEPDAGVLVLVASGDMTDVKPRVWSALEATLYTGCGRR
jgi:hypothetical protein